MLLLRPNSPLTVHLSTQPNTPFLTTCKLASMTENSTREPLFETGPVWKNETGLHLLQRPWPVQRTGVEMQEFGLLDSVTLAPTAPPAMPGTDLQSTNTARPRHSETQAQVTWTRTAPLHQEETQSHPVDFHDIQRVSSLRAPKTDIHDIIFFLDYREIQTL